MLVLGVIAVDPALGRDMGDILRYNFGRKVMSVFDEAVEWLDRAEQAREVAGQLTDPGARRAVLELADSFDRLARAAASPTVARRRELARRNPRGNS